MKIFLFATAFLFLAHSAFSTNNQNFKLLTRTSDDTSDSMKTYENSGLPKFIMGACTHFWQGKGILNKNIEMLKQGGFNSLRDEATWGAVESVKDQYTMPEHALKYLSYASENGVLPLLILDYANKHYNNGGYPETPDAIDGFANYATFMAKNLKGKVRLYQIWNEWDGGCGMPKELKGKSTATGYAKLLEKTYNAIKQQDKDAIVMMNSICKGDSFFEESLATGVLKNCDIATLHTYNYSLPTSLNDAQAWYSRMNGIENLIRKYNGGKLKPLIITEMGWPNQTNKAGSSYERTATESVRMYLLAKTLPWLKGIYWYDFQDDGNLQADNENNFGLVRLDLTPKPAFYALMSISDIIKNADFKGFIESTNKDLKILKFKLGTEDVIAMWNLNYDSRLIVTFKNSSEEKQPIRIFTAGAEESIRKWGLRDFLSDKKNKPQSDKLAFTVGSMPIILKGDFSNVAIDSIEVNPFNTRMADAVTASYNIYVPQAPKVSDTCDFSFNTITPWRPVKEVYFGNEDISANFDASYTPDALNITIRVKDQLHNANSNNHKFSDYAQIILNANPRTNQNLDIKILAENDGAKIICDSLDLTKDKTLLKAQTSRQDNITTYSISINPEALGLKKFARGKAIAGAILVNDNDNEGESLDSQIIVRWSDAAAREAINRSKFNLLILGDI